MTTVTLQEIATKLENHFAVANITAKCNNAYFTPQEEKYDFTITKSPSLSALNRFIKELCFYTGFTYEKRNGAGAITLSRTRDTRQFVNINDTFAAIKDKIETDENGKQKCYLCFGKGADGYVTANFEECAHILIAGTTGSGKSCLMNSLIIQALCFSNANLIMIDPKGGAEFGLYEQDVHNRIEHVAKNAQDAVKWLKIAVDLMESRYAEMSCKGLKKYDGNRIIVIIDELADLMMMSKAEVEEHIIRIAQKGRAAGVHLIVATQDPRASVVTGLIKYNLPTKVCLKTANARHSMNVIDCGKGAELLDKGDGYVKLPSSPNLQRVQAPYCSDEQIYKLITTRSK